MDLIVGSIALMRASEIVAIAVAVLGILNVSWQAPGRVMLKTCLLGQVAAMFASWWPLVVADRVAATDARQFEELSYETICRS
jgi:hypothetical protein